MAQSCCGFTWSAEDLENSGDLNTKLVWYSNGQKGVGCQMVWYLNTGQPNHLNTGQTDATLFSYELVWYLNGWSSTWRMAHKATIWIPNHLKSELWNVRYSYVSGIQMISIQIPTVFFETCYGFTWSAEDLEYSLRTAEWWTFPSSFSYHRNWFLSDLEQIFTIHKNLWGKIKQAKLHSCYKTTVRSRLQYAPAMCGRALYLPCNYSSVVLWYRKSFLETSEWISKSFWSNVNHLSGFQLVELPYIRFF